MKPHLSGWCSPCTPGDNAHDTCQGHLDAGRLPRGCACPDHPHPPKPTPAAAPPRRGYW